MRNALFGFMGLAGLSFPASALVISETQNFTLDNIDNNSIQTNQEDPVSGTFTESSILNFSRWDPAANPGFQLGGVKISYSGSVTQRSGVSASDEYYDWFLIFPLGYLDGADVEGNFSTLFTLSLVDPSGDSVMASDSVSLSCSNPGGGSQSCEQQYNSGAIDFSGLLDLDSFSLGDFTGTSPVSFELSNAANVLSGKCTYTEGTTENFCSMWNDGLWSGSITVEYTAAEVPAPATLALVGLTLAGLGLAGRRKARLNGDPLQKAHSGGLFFIPPERSPSAAWQARPPIAPAMG
ncbi:MAG: hypothetical protein CME59_23010 [Halioglobus sp.]|nr:hypothetical protein [Halioglobus sp.]